MLFRSVPIPVVIAGSPSFRDGFNGDGGPAISALLRGPEGIALAPNGDIYFVDAGNRRLRRIDSAGIITSVAGNGEIESVASDGPITSAVLSEPSRVAIDAQSNIFVTEGLSRSLRLGGGRIRRISGGRIDTIAGLTISGFGGDGGSADRKSTRLNSSHLRLSRMPSSA